MLLNPLLLRPLEPPTKTMCEAPRDRVDDSGVGEGEGEGEALSPQSAAFACRFGGGTGATVFRQPPSVATTAAPVINSGTTGELFRRADAMGRDGSGVLESAGSFTGWER